MRRTGIALVVGALVVSVLFGVLNATASAPAWLAVSVRIACSGVALYGFYLIVVFSRTGTIDEEP